MEINNPNPPATAGPTPSTPIVPPVPVTNGSRMILWLVVGLIVVVLAVGGIYLFLSRQQATPPVNPLPVTKVPSPSPQENLENDLNNIDVAAPDNDFTSIDQDLQAL